MPEPERATLYIFIAMSVLGGGNSVAMRFSNRELDPFWGAAIRFAFAAALALLIMAFAKQAIPQGRSLLGAVLYGLIAFGGAPGLAYYGLVEIQAGLAQTVVAIVPLLTLLLAVAQRQERLHFWAVVGTVLALAGVAVVSGAGFGDAVPVGSLIALLGAAFCFAEASVLVRSFPPVPPLAMNGVGMAVGAVVLFFISAVRGEEWAMPRAAETWLAIAFLAAVGSVLLFVMYIVVLRAWTASRASYSFVIVPIVTIALSAWLDDESVGSELVFGAALVLAGVYFGALRPAHRGAHREHHIHHFALHRPH